MGKRYEIQFYNAKSGESLTLPINPEEVELENAVNIQTYNILGYGEVSVSGSKVLQRLNLSNLLPDENNTYFAQLASLITALDYKPYTLKDAIGMLNRWVDNQDIIRIIVSDRLNKEFRLERYIDTVRESVSDSPYSIEAIEYRNPTDKRTNTQYESNLAKLKKRTINKYIPNQKVLKSGMTIYKLAKLTYGGKFNELATLNSVIDANADLGGKIVEMLPL